MPSSSLVLVIIFYKQTDSTNRIAKELIKEGQASAGMVVHAGCQSAGRGQHGRTFNSPIGGLYFSLIEQPNLAPSDLPLITLATGLACRERIFSLFGIATEIKWPNDIYIHQKKVAGILCESILAHGFGDSKTTVVVGVGVNVHSVLTEFPVELQPLVTTLAEHVHVPLDISHLVQEFVNAIRSRIADLITDRAGVLEQWQRYDVLHDKKIVYTTPQGTIVGQGCGIDSSGRYRILDENNLEHAILGGQLRLLEKDGCQPYESLSSSGESTV